MCLLFLFCFVWWTTQVDHVMMHLVNKLVFLAKLIIMDRTVTLYEQLCVIVPLGQIVNFSGAKFPCLLSREG